MSSLSERDFQIALDLELALLLDHPRAPILSMAQIAITVELQAWAECPSKQEIDAFALAVILIAAGRKEELTTYRISEPAQSALWIPRARELLLEAVRKAREVIYQEGL